MVHHIDKERLLFRRQYVLAPAEFGCPFLHNKYALEGGYLLYTHPDLNVTDVPEGDARLCLLGDIYDYSGNKPSNPEIVRHLLEKNTAGVIDASHEYTGRYVIIYQREGTTILFTDATATRKVYFCKTRSGMWCASQPHLLAGILGLDRTSDPGKLEFYSSDKYLKLNKSNIGYHTLYDPIRQLLPNHLLDADSGNVRRFWPDKPIGTRPLEEVTHRCAGMIKGYMESISHRHKIMLPVTAGFDSRMLMAGTKEISDRVFYYINRNKHLSDKSRDIAVPRRLFGKLGLEFHVLDLPRRVDPDFRRLYYKNNPQACEAYLPHIFNYFRFHQDRVNCPGNFAAATWGTNRLKLKNLSAESLARLYSLDPFRIAVDTYGEWLKGSLEACKRTAMNPVTLFYWEERLANWGGQIQLEKDIAQEDINPLNSRMFIFTYLSAERKFRNVPDHLLHRRIIQRLWPELLSVPINPGIRRNYLTAMKRMGLLPLILWIRYRDAR